MLCGRLTAVQATDAIAGRGVWGGLTSDGQPTPHSYSASADFAVASIEASDFRTWLRSVVYQKSGSDALR